MKIRGVKIIVIIENAQCDAFVDSGRTVILSYDRVRTVDARIESRDHTGFAHENKLGRLRRTTFRYLEKRRAIINNSSWISVGNCHDQRMAGIRDRRTVLEVNGR